MKTFFAGAIGALLFCTTVSLRADPAAWVRQAVSPDPAVAPAAQDHLRDMGPDGLKALMETYAKEIAAHQKGAVSDEAWKKIETALNHVGGQYDNDASGLYWYTDLEKAKAAAQASGKPILSLRLLGRLDEDLSCANSRFFRTTLYPNAQVNQLLRNNFILHWESVRPVPVVTIDFGNGRKLVRTITGNSIHYVLNPSGQIVDALPGLYGAATFAKELGLAAAAVNQDMPSPIPGYLDNTRKRLLAAWRDDLGATITSISLTPPATEESELESMTDDKAWQRIAAKHENEVAFDLASQEVIVHKFPPADDAAPLAMSKSVVEVPMLKVMRNLKRTVSLDTVRNNYLLRTKILAFLESPQAQGRSLTEINDWIYAAIFLTPKSDPWLGLAPQDVFSGIDQNGEKL